MRARLKVFSSFLAAVMIIMSFTAMVSASGNVVASGTYDAIEWTYYDDNSLKVSFVEGYTAENPNIYLYGVPKEYLESALTIDIDYSNLPSTKSYFSVSAIDVPAEVVAFHGGDLERLTIFGFTDNLASVTMDRGTTVANLNLSDIKASSLRPFGLISNVTNSVSVNFAHNIKYLEVPYSLDYFSVLNCSNLKELAVTGDIEGLTVNECEMLSDIELNDSVEYLYLYSLPEITEFEIPDYIDECSIIETGISSISVPADCRAHIAGDDFVEATLESGRTSINEWMFSGAESLRSVNIPEGVTSIEYGGFRYCSSLKSVDLPETLEIIDGKAFSESGIETITLPLNVKEIEMTAFAGCESLTDVYYDGTRAELEQIEITSMENDDTSDLTVFDIFDESVTIHYKDDSVEKYKVTVGSVTNGTASVSKTEAEAGEKITVTAKPNTGYELDTIKVNGKAISGNTFTMPAQDTTVTVTFKKINYKVTVGSVSNGTVTVSKSTANYGDTITVTAKPNTGYVLDTILVNGKAISGNTFKMPAKDTTVTATFKKASYKVTVGSVSNGTVTVSKSTANYGDTITVTAKPNTGYMLDQILVNGKSISGNTFKMPAKDTTVTATFKKVLYNVTVNTPKNGTAALSRVKASLGDTVTVTAKPNTGYELDTIKVNGKVISGTSFTMPATDTIVEVTFKKVIYTLTVGKVTNGKVTLSASTATYGDTVFVKAEPNIGYELDQILVNGSAIKGESFKMPAQNTVVTATFKKAKLKGWQKSGNDWLFYDDSGIAVTGWNKINGAWYFFNDAGIMQTGWLKSGSDWYYLRSSGSMYTGWLKYGNTWYYLESSGRMATGWEKVDGTWYLFNGSGAMLTGWQKSGGNWYYLTGSGAMKTGWLLSGGKWYYLTPSGAMATGWMTIGGNKYYFDPVIGFMVTGTVKIDGRRYVFDDNGHLLR